ncbi:MAG TPA: hypothetical protein VJM53_10050, partial [Burkholderiales bacterium]|nr:hypothetical protein [Burkholderiales bacterium]
MNKKKSRHYRLGEEGVGRPCIASEPARARLAVAVAAALAMTPAFVHAAGPDQCAVLGGGDVAHCTGDQRQGIATGSSLLSGGAVLNSAPITFLFIDTLTQNIAPASGTDGV